MIQTSINRMFVSPGVRFPNPERIRTQLKWVLFLRVMVLTILLGISVLLQNKSHSIDIPSLRYIAIFIGWVYLYTICSLVVLKYIKRYTNFALLQITSDAVMISCIVFGTGGSQSIFTILYFLPILTGSFLLLRLGGLLMAATCTMSYGFIVLVEIIKSPWLVHYIKTPLNDITVAMHFFAIHGIVFFMVAALGIALFERMKQTESALTQSNINFDRLSVMYKQIFDDITTGIITVGESGRINSFNRAAETITGFQLHEVEGRKIQKLFPGLSTSPAANKVRQLTDFQRRDGLRIPLGYSWTRLNMPDSNEDYRVYTMQDLSQIREMERQVKQAEKMATIGEMAAGIAHEFRNPLAAISGAAQILFQDCRGDSAQHKLTNIISRESDRLEKTIDEFLQFSKPSEPDKNWFSLKRVIEETIQLLTQGREWQEMPAHRIRYDRTDLDCWADPRQVQQIIINLITNACHAMAKKEGKITIIAEEIKDQDHQEMTRITVNDTGPGIPLAVIKQVCEPFFTTRENGTGLGLAIVKQITINHGGRISVETSARGTTFAILLPLPPQA